MVEILQHFCIFHVNAPGQEDGASLIPETEEYSSMDDLAEIVSVPSPTHFVWCVSNP